MEHDHTDHSHDNDKDDVSSNSGDKANYTGGDTVTLLTQDTNLTLGKKKSWFGSLREMGSKLGLRAKGPGASSKGEENNLENEAPPTPKHKRNSSVANSVVGSLRSLRHRNWKGPESPTSKRRSMSVEVPPEQVPLPSSPINIAPTAPTLHLDIGSDGFMSTTFISRALTDPANITTGTPIESRQLHIPPEVEATFTQEKVDGATSDRSEGSDKSKIFERSVTPPNDPERRTLRHMRSLNAIAETYTAEQAAIRTVDDVATQTECVDSKRSPTPFETPESTHYTSHQGIGSGSTVASPPSDMPQLARQDHFTVGTPTPGAQLTLPFRLKTETEGSPEIVPAGAQDSRAVNETSLGNEAAEDQRFDLQGSSEPLDRPRVEENSGDAFPLRHLSPERAEDSTVPAVNENAQDHIPSVVPSVVVYSDDNDTANAIEELVFATRIPDEPVLCQYMSPADMLIYIHSLENGIHKRSLLQSFAPDNKIEVNSGDHSTSYEARPSEEWSVISSTDEYSTNGGPVIPELYHCIPSKESPGSGSSRSRTTYTAGLGDANYKFCLENWLKGTPSPPSTGGEERTSPRREMSASIDSSSAKESATSPGTAQFLSDIEKLENAIPTPTMGSRVEFDLKRSQRNIRYNALYQEVSVYCDPCEEIDANALACVDIDKAYASSPAGPPISISHAEDDKENVPAYEAEDSAGTAESDLASISQQLAECITVLEGKGSISKGESAESNQGLVDLVMRSKKDGPASVSTSDSGSSNRKPLQAFNDVGNRLSKPHVVFEEVGTNVEATHGGLRSGSANRVTSFKSRAVSSDTLDDSLNLFSSPDSGYEADKDTLSPPSDSNTPTIKRTHSPSK